MADPSLALERLHLSDVRGLAGLAVQATQDVTRVVEGVHRSVHATLGLPGAADTGRTGGLTGLVYRSIDSVTRLTGTGIDAALALAEPLARRLGHEPTSSREREVALGILNGVLGDRLAASGNPLALPMSLHHAGRQLEQGAPPASAGVSGRILVLIHGLCMTEHGWRRSKRAGQPNPASGMAEHLPYSPLYLRYNTGCALAASGAEFADRLEALIARWPVPVERLVLLGHSMGGLVARSAVKQGAKRGDQWIQQLNGLIFLGTPHHGAPLERAGAWVDSLLQKTPYTRPFATLSQGRSQGIRDLRHGLPGEGPGSMRGLPEGVGVLAVAGTRSSRRRLRQSEGRPDALAGDGLVPVTSALGRLGDREGGPVFDPVSRLILPRTGHMDLLHSPEAARSVQRWLVSLER